MRLGQFLEASHTEREQPAPTKPVAFKIIKRLGRGQELVKQVTAVLAFVDEAKRDRAIDAAEAACRRVYQDGSAPPEKRRNELAYQLLLYALRDADEPRAQFASTIDELRSALVQPVATDLYDQYVQFLAEEFPAAPTKEQFDELVEDAAKNS
jgi:hypothetical protein